MNTSSATSDRQITDPPGINNRCKPASIAKTRWIAYAAAGAATALAGSQSAQAAIHYSGRVNELFLVGEADTLKLDRPGDFFRLSHTSYGYGANDKFAIFGIASAAFRGFLDIFTNRHYVSKLTFGQPISMGNFIQQSAPGLMVRNGQPHQWWNPGQGFIGFRFNNGAGVQYGWARIKMSGPPHHNFILFDYAYADPGEGLRAGQTSSDEQAADQGSLGWLALGAVGLLAWRKSRSRTARLEDA